MLLSLKHLAKTKVRGVERSSLSNSYKQSYNCGSKGMKSEKSQLPQLVES